VSIGLHFGQNVVQYLVCRYHVFRPHGQVVFSCCSNVGMSSKLLDFRPSFEPCQFVGILSDIIILKYDRTVNPSAACNDMK